MNCAYTGATMTLEFDEDVRHSGWWLRGGFDPSVGFLTREEAVAAFCRRPRGRKVKTPRCAYTGAEVSLVCRDGLWFAEGDVFNPRDRVPRKQDLLSMASRRAGKAPTVPPAARVQAVVEREQVSDPTEGRGRDAEFDNFVEESVDNLVKGPTS